MHNGCLLLLAFVAVFQPIASYTERGLVDGRQQRCDYRTSVHDPGLNFHGTYRFNKPTLEDRRLNHREDTRKVRRNEVREETLRITSSSDKRLADTSERDRGTLTRLSKARIGNDAVLRRENRETRLDSSRRDDRNREIRRERLLRVQKIHQARFDSRRENSGLSDENCSQRIDNRVSVESRRNIPGNGINEATNRVREHQEVRVEINRVMDNVASSVNDRRIVRDTFGRMDTRRSASRIQRDRSVDRETLGRRSSREFRSLSTSGSTVNRAYEDTRSLDRNDRRTVSSQRLDNEQKQRDSRIRLTVEKRNIRDTVRRVLDDRTSENSRYFQRLQRAQSTGSRKDNRDTENRARLARAVRSVDDLASQNDRSVSRIRRERAAENRRDLEEARNMVRTLSLERSAEYRNDFRSSDRISENRIDNRNIERETRQNIGSIRVAQTCNSNRDTCVFDRELSSEHRMTRKRSQEGRQLAPNVESRAFRTERTGEGRQGVREITIQAFRAERITESGRDARNIEHRAFRNERADQSRRDARTVIAQSFRAERSDESQQDIRNIAVREFRKVRSDESRQDGARNTNSRLLRAERTSESRRDAREGGIGAFRTERPKENRQRARNVEDRVSRTVRADKTHIAAREDRIRALEQSDETQRSARNIEVRASETATNRHRARDVERQSRSLDRITDSRRERQNNIRDSRIQERALESRRNIRNIEFRSEAERSTNTNQRAVHSLEREIRSMVRERWSMESLMKEKNNQDSRMFTTERRSADRRERNAGNSRDVRNVHKDIRSVDAREMGVESRRMNWVRSGNVRATERLSKRDSFDSRRTYTLQRESRRDENETKTPIMNWQYFFYALQGLYICGMLMQLNKESVEKKTRVSWWPAPQHLIKVD